MVSSKRAAPHALRRSGRLTDDVAGFPTYSLAVREYLEQLLVVLAVGSGVAIFARRVTIPYNVALVVVGLLLVLFAVVPETPMDPGVVLMVFLPILIFQGALSADAASLKLASRPILVLALPAVAVSLLATAAIA